MKCIGTAPRSSYYSYFVWIRSKDKVFSPVWERDNNRLDLSIRVNEFLLGPYPFDLGVYGFSSLVVK